jgi:hypothetical protein
MQPVQPRGFRIREAAIYMGLSPWTVEVLIAKGHLCFGVLEKGVPLFLRGSSFGMRKLLWLPCAVALVVSFFAPEIACIATHLVSSRGVVLEEFNRQVLGVRPGPQSRVVKYLLPR